MARGRAASSWPREGGRVEGFCLPAAPPSRRMRRPVASSKPTESIYGYRASNPGGSHSRTRTVPEHERLPSDPCERRLPLHGAGGGGEVVGREHRECSPAERRPLLHVPDEALPRTEVPVLDGVALLLEDVADLLRPLLAESGLRSVRHGTQG